MSQDKLMKFCPATGTDKPYPSHAAQWREYHGKVAWLYNPWTKVQRDARDIGSDTFGYLIADSSTDIKINCDASALGQLKSLLPENEVRKYLFK